MQTEVVTLSEERKVTLTCYLQQTGGEFGHITKRPALLLLPGGGYSMCSDREADPVAFPFLAAGFQVLILRYSVRPYSTWPQPLRDYEEAMTMIRTHADAWGIYEDKIAVCGFSAGGHLAGSAATLSSLECRPNAALLIYPVLNEASAHDWQADAPGLIDKVDENTPPCFLACARNDDMVPALNTLEFTLALCKADISFESHVYSYGGHGYSVGDSTVCVPDYPITPRAGHWVEDSIAWLKEVFGDFGLRQLTAPKVGHFSMEDHSDHYSFGCTMGQIRQNPEALTVAMDLIADIRAGMSAANMLMADTVLDRMKIKDLLSFVPVDSHAADGVEEKLKTITK